MIYDTSGPYTDLNVETDIRQGLKPLRLDWILGRGDVEELPGSSYQPTVKKNGKAKDAQTERFPDAARRPILRAKPGCNVSQMHYAKKGIITPEMEYIAIRENLGRQQALENGTRRQWPYATPVTVSARRFPSSSRPSLSAMKSRAAARSFRPTSIIRKANR